MKKHTNPGPESTLLRRKAEDVLKMKKAEKITLFAESDAIKLLHELHVHQIELEMQNEELVLAKNQAADLAAEKYNELYDFAPTGYFTLSRDGKILKLNFSGADMLGIERSRLIGNPFSFYVSDNTKPVFNHFLDQAFISDFKQLCEVTLLIKGKEPLYIQLSGICSVSYDECLVTATDITGRIHAEELLKQKEAVLTRQNELFSQLLKNLQIGVFMVEAPSGKPLMANEKALELLGRGILPDANKHNRAEVYKAYKAGGRQPYPPEEMPILLGINGQSAHIDDMLVLRPDGTEILLEISGTPVKDKDENVWASLVSFMDITDRKKAEAAIRLSEEKFRGIFNQTSVGAAIVNMEKRFLQCNPAFCNFLGYSEEELIGKLISDVTLPDDVSLGMKELKQMAEMKFESATLEKRYLRKDGTVVWGGININLVCDEKNSPIFFLTLIQDITERKRAEEALKQSEKHFHELADSITDVFFEMDTDLRYTYWNKASENLLGITAEAAIGKSIREIFPDSVDIARAEAVYREVVKTRKSHMFEIEFEYNGKRTIFEIRVYPTEKGISVFTSDITGRKRAEAEIKIKNEELQKTNAEKDKFFSIIAHDLRSPFNAFLGLTQLMEEELPSLSPDEIQNFAASMRKSANMLFHLLENLLEWSRMQRGLLSFKPQAVLLSNEINGCIELVRDAADKKMIAIRQDIPRNLYVNADAQMFESVMRNLLFNAIKFTPKNGEITLAAKIIPDTMVQISVSDTGIGMDQELISKLFLLDEQAQRKGTEGEPSTGLGLIICRDLVEKHGGSVRVESKVGEGSTFHFTIPSDNAAAENSAQNNNVRTAAPINPPRKLKILIVDDDEISKLLISTALNPYSREILFTRTGTETVEVARHNPDIDLIMMDIQMPEMDGYQATQLIRGFNENVIIIAQTAHGLTGDIEKSLLAGCNDHIAKPINMSFLKRLMQKHFNK
jgi:PAS domain S-box-containing protein